MKNLVKQYVNVQAEGHILVVLSFLATRLVVFLRVTAQYVHVHGRRLLLVLVPVLVLVLVLVILRKTRNLINSKRRLIMSPEKNGMY